MVRSARDEKEIEVENEEREEEASRRETHEGKTRSDVAHFKGLSFAVCLLSFLNAFTLAFDSRYRGV